MPHSRIAFVAFVCAAYSCASPAEPAAEPRHYLLGFSANPPRLETAAVLQTVEMWIPRSDGALLALSVPWTKMLQGISARSIIRQEQLELVQLYRARGLANIVVMVDATNGIAREREAEELVALGRSIREPAVQAVYREYLMAVDSILHPSYLALAMETNLTRLTAPRPVYDAPGAGSPSPASLRGSQTTSAIFLSSTCSACRRILTWPASPSRKTCPSTTTHAWRPPRRCRCSSWKAAGPQARWRV